ncbi:ATP-binding protein [Natrarchaeobius chitinivorans]|uniref:histidine kinase n=1 Tax=Natrarchaeobius chitinivorans TaxID=1679083 RepID=A0A3N6M0K2_NATCH|nr:ATP-binding protein [Natrarchaeobius chitinivorans]RQG93814.1 histidine kinase [Natrarchaeobius chitinivorans]
MNFEGRLIERVGGRRIIILLGTVFITAALIRGYLRVDLGTPLSSAVFVSVFVTIPGVVLVYGGYRLPKTDIHPDFHSTVTKWTLGGFVSMVLFLIVYDFIVEGGITNPDRAFTILPAFSSLAGFWLGIREGRTETSKREVENTIARLEESNQRLEQFAYAASHDLQEPLRMVSAYLRLIEKRSDDLSEENQEFLEFAVDGADRMHEMVESLLVYSRIDSEGQSFAAVDLDDVAADVVTDLQVRIDEADAEVTVDDLSHVEGDEDQLYQLLLNVVSNALEYTDDPPRIHVSAERNGSESVVSVRDSGIGIEPEKQDEIFEIFNRLHSRDEHPGTGIGLALCDRIVDRHGGEIWVESESERGSTFSFTLPTATSPNN